MSGWPPILRRALAAAVPSFVLLAQPASASCIQPGTITPAYRRQALRTARHLGVAPRWVQTHNWHLQPQAARLARAGKDVFGRVLQLTPHTAGALQAMLTAAAREGVVLQPVSGFRSFGYQRTLVRRKRDRGMPLPAVLRIHALPGFSEHHSGCALDFTTPGVPAADPAFAGTPAFHWLMQHAGAYGFHLSYPAGNLYGIAFEPWHWRYGAVPADIAGHDPPPAERNVADATATAGHADPIADR